MAVLDFRLGPRVGSDHFPVIARLRVAPEEGRLLNVAPQPLEGEEREEIEARMAAYREKLAQGEQPTPRPEVPSAAEG